MEIQSLNTPSASPKKMYKLGFLFIYVTYIVPIPFLIVDILFKKPDWFPPSGAIVLFLAAFVEFKQLSSRLQNKHILNAQRAQNNDPALPLSKEYRKLEKYVFWAGVYGTVTWAYGDKMVRILVAIVYT